MKHFLLAFTLLITIITSACIGNNNVGSFIPNQNVITINNSGIIPIFKNRQTISEIFVHNYAAESIKDISYSVFINTDGIFKPALDFIDSNSCSSIAASSSCRLKFTTPKMNVREQGSALITLKYQFNGQLMSFSQILNFKTISSSVPNFTSGVNISGFGHSTGYGTVYLYGNGSHDELIVNSDKYAIRLDKNSSNLSLNIQTESWWVQAIEINTLTTKQAVAAKLSLISAKSTLATVAAMVSPIASGGILVSSQIPVINTTNTSNSTASLTLTNVGNAALTLGTSSATAGVNNLSGCASGSILAIGDSCIMTFSVSQSNGSANITINYTGGTTSRIIQAVTWFNSMNGALISMSYNTSAMLSLNQAVTVPVTLTNIGGYNLTNLVPVQTVNGINANATISYPSNNSCQGITLNLESSCSFILNINDTIVENNKQLLFQVQGSYNNGSAQSYLRYAILDYSVAPPTYLYANNGNADVLYAFTQNTATGTLTEMSNSPITDGSAPWNLVLTLNNKYLYVFNGANSSIFAYSVNSSNGLLNYVGNYSSGGLNSPSFVLLSPNGKFIYGGAIIFNNNIYAYSINSSNGITYEGANSLGGTMLGMVMDSGGNYLYATSYNNKITSFKVNQTTGQLTLNGSSLATGTTPVDIEITPNNKFIYVANSGSSTISIYKVQSDGTLSSAGVGTGETSPGVLFITPDSRFLYAAGSGQAMTGYSIDQTTGALTSVGVFPLGAYGYGAGVITSDGKYLYVSTQNSNATQNFAAFSIDQTTGNLSVIGYYGASGGAANPYIDTNGYLYSSNSSNAVNAFKLNTDGSLSSVPGNPFSVGANAGPVSIQMAHIYP